ncbi:probable alpha-glucosidase isoform X2 [Bacillus rossius redtenbacheri]|uniref:probable alpha-glucosidase isoform X2 n=1 Tax=Bacillus rossius redtenbacheri TaxID=93214 RepID=UPI002FDE6500
MNLAPSPSMLAAGLPGPMGADRCDDEEVASICPLLTPSPSSGFDHPLAIISQAAGGMSYGQKISPTSIDNMEIPTLAALSGNAALGYVGLTAARSEHSQGNTEGEPRLSDAGSSVVGSSSSSSSALHEPTACAQLLGARHYQHLATGAHGDAFACQENGGKPALAARRAPGEYCFLAWNWPLIRKASFWGCVSLLVACTCVVIAVMASLPGECSPPRRWWQGSLFYEIFPGSFQDSNADTIGDFQGIRSRVQYLKSLGVRAVRLNSIFPAADHYPEGYDTPRTLSGIERALGTERDFEALVGTLHRHNISVVLDLPLHPHFHRLRADDEGERGIAVSSSENATDDDNFTGSSPSSLLIPPLVQVQEQESVVKTLEYWLRRDVDGFYLKGLENFTEEPDFPAELRRWRRILDGSGREKILMCSVHVVDVLAKSGDAVGLRSVLGTIDLVDVLIELAAGNGTARGVKQQVNDVMSGPLYSEPVHPWVHWRVGGEGVQRLSSRLPTANGSLAALLLFSLLPGTPSVFYGDEIGLMDSSDPEGDRSDMGHLYHLAPMHWTQPGPDVGFTRHGILPWLPRSESWSYIGAGRQSALRDVARLRQSTPCIFMDGVWKEHRSVPNYELRNVGRDLLVLERWYPRRNSYVVVANLGPAVRQCDLSSRYYGGEVVADLQGRVGRWR